MPKITLLSRSKLPLEIPHLGDNSLMQDILAAGWPVASSCGGKGVCAKCQVEVVAGAENLSPANEVEVFAKNKGKWPQNIRMSCQCLALGDCSITCSYW